MEYLVDDIVEVTDFLRHPRVQEYHDNPSASIRLISADGEYLYASSGVHALLGYVPSDFVKLNGWDLAHPDDVATLKATAAALANGGGAECVVRARKKDGEYRWVHTEFAPFQGYLAVVVRPAAAPVDGRAHWSSCASFLE